MTAVYRLYDQLMDMGWKTHAGADASAGAEAAGADRDNRRAPPALVLAGRISTTIEQ
jgi:hypothetical protein